MIAAFGIGVALGIFGLTLLLVFELRQKHLHLWLGSYFAQRARARQARREALARAPIHVLFCMVDHFEPISAGSTSEIERARMQDWLVRYPALAKRHHDSHDRPVQHSWFYPGEAYHPEYLNNLVELCQQGIGEIELHLHHGHDTEASLRKKINDAMILFGKHGALRLQRGATQPVYAFIHGNMALDNSLNDPQYCGVNGELRVLRETGCYADFSLPTAPCESQPSMVNTIYYATDDPHAPKSFETGEEVTVNGTPSGDLMMVAGPLTFNWSSRKWGLIPRIDNGEIQVSNPPTLERVRNWVRQHIHVKGKPEWVFVKVSCHGAEDRSRDVILGDIADRMYSDLENEYRDGSGYRLHYVTARELYNVIKAAEAGKSGDPTEYYDYVLPPYRTHRVVRNTPAST
jgi:hypothetical protein